MYPPASAIDVTNFGWLRRFVCGGSRRPRRPGYPRSATAGGDLCEVRDIQLSWLGDTTCAFDLRLDKRYVGWPSRTKLNLTSFHLPSRCLVTLIPVPEGETVLSKDWLVRYIDDVLLPDDVFDKAFFDGIIFFGPQRSKPRLDPEAKDILKCRGNTWHHFQSTANLDRPLRPGPYACVNNELWEAWRLHQDHNDTMMVSLKPTNGLDGPKDFGYEEFIFPSSKHGLSVAVPSRVCFDRTTPGRPLDGLRVLVKDNYNIRGVRTSVCNKAYLETYPPCSQTAVALQTLVRKGAVLLGKTKLSSFAGREEPTECIDYPAPLNPRADGYQSPAGSSSGSGAAAAAYAYVDVTIGTDTTGSGRRPGHWNGCFALRPTHGLIKCDGIVPNFEMFDTPSLMARDLRLMKDFAQAWYALESEAIPRALPFPTTVIYPTDYLPVANKHQNTLINSFLKALEATTNIQRVDLSIAGLWRKHPPPGIQGEDLDINVYLKAAGTEPFFYDDYHNFAQFRDDYRRKFNKMPYVTPYISWKWQTAQTISKTQRDAAVSRLLTYKAWLLEHVLRPHTVVVLPIQELFPNYRDLKPPEPVAPTGFSGLYMSPIVGAPEIVVPFGHVPYPSRITSRTEYLPCAVSLVGPPNSDVMLLDLALATLEKVGNPTRLDAGTIMFWEPMMGTQPQPLFGVGGAGAGAVGVAGDAEKAALGCCGG